MKDRLPEAYHRTTPQYFFPLRPADDLVHDDEGRGMPVKAIQDFALISARSIIAADIGDGVLDLRGRIEVEEDQGETFVTLRFRDAIRSVGWSMDLGFSICRSSNCPVSSLAD